VQQGGGPHYQLKEPRRTHVQLMLARVPVRPLVQAPRPALARAMSSLRHYPLAKDTQLVLQQGDITRWQGDAIVNAGTCASLTPLCRARAVT